MAVNSYGSEFTYSDGAWSRHFIDPNFYAEGGGIGPEAGLTSVSCPISAFCVAVDAAGYEFTYRGGSWSHGNEIDAISDANPNGFLTAVSCASKTFCLAVPQFAQSEITYSDPRWSQPQQIDPNGGSGWGFTSVSCPQPTFCVTTSWEGGYEFTYSGQSAACPRVRRSLDQCKASAPQSSHLFWGPV